MDQQAAGANRHSFAGSRAIMPSHVFGGQNPFEHCAATLFYDSVELSLGGLGARFHLRHCDRYGEIP